MREEHAGQREQQGQRPLTTPAQRLLLLSLVPQPARAVGAAHTAGRAVHWASEVDSSPVATLKLLHGLGP